MHLEYKSTRHETRMKLDFFCGAIFVLEFLHVSRRCECADFESDRTLLNEHNCLYDPFLSTLETFPTIPTLQTAPDPDFKVIDNLTSLRSCF